MNKRLYIKRTAILPLGVPPQTDLPPAAFRRRLTPVQKAVLWLCEELHADAQIPLFFSSQHGENALSQKLIHQYKDERDVSPFFFSTSVYNAAPGFFSIFTKNRASYTALAAGKETLECGLLDAFSASHDRIWVYAEESDSNSYGCAAWMTDEETPRPLHILPGAQNTSAIDFEQLVSFFSRKFSFLSGKFLTLSWDESSK